MSGTYKNFYGKRYKLYKVHYGLGGEAYALDEATRMKRQGYITHVSPVPTREYVRHNKHKGVRQGYGIFIRETK